MSLLSQLLYESSKTEQVKKRGGKIFQPKKKKKNQPRGGERRCVDGSGGGVLGVLEVFLRPPTGFVKSLRQPETCVTSGASMGWRSTGEHREVRYYLLFLVV